MNDMFLVDKKDGGSTKQLLSKALGSTLLKKPISIVTDPRVLEIASVIHKKRLAREIVEKLFQSGEPGTAVTKKILRSFKYCLVLTFEAITLWKVLPERLVN